MQPFAKSDFSIKTAIFEGPLELLLDLVEKRKLLINDISLASVTDEYMQHVNERQEMSLPNTAQFITLAATLLLVKSKSLLPVMELTEEEESSIVDLEERLKQYQIIRDAALLLQDRFGKNCLYSPQFAPPKANVFVPDQYCNKDNLRESIYEMINSLPQKEVPVKATVKATISLDKMIEKLERRIAQNSRLSFSQIKAHDPERRAVIVGFLAILELFKQGNLIITQAQCFSDIEIELDKGQTPTYF